MWSFRKEIHKYGIGLLPDPPCALGMDVVFVMDYTGSMGPVIEEAKISAAAIATAIEAQSNPNSYRLSLVISDEVNKGSSPTYSGSVGYTSLLGSQKSVNTTGPTTDQYTTAMEMLDLIDNEVSFTNQLNTINTATFPLGGGVGGPEPLDIALDLIVNSDFVNSFRTNRSKYILIFTDNLPGGDDDTYDGIDNIAIANLAQDCIDKKIKVFVLGAGASNAVWQNLAVATGGNFNTSFDGTVIVSQIIATCENLIPPTAVAGVDQTIQLPMASVNLDGSASFDGDGAVVAYLWEIVSGPVGSSVANPNSATTSVTGLLTGDYVIRLTVTDNDGLQDTDFITVSVQDSVLACGSSQAFSSPTGAGVYYTTIDLGTDIGLVTLDYDAASIPDRFQIEYDGVIVADSLLVGDHLSGNPPDANTTLWEPGSGSGQFVGRTYNNIPDLEWNGSNYVTTGSTNNYVVQQSDVAPFGSEAGAGQISFNKPNASPTTMRVIVTSFPDNTGWNFTTNCPIPPQVLRFGISSTLNNWQTAQQLLGAPSTLVWDVTGGVTDNQVGTLPVFDLSGNSGVADFTVQDVIGVTKVTFFDSSLPTGNVEYLDVTELIDLETIDIRSSGSIINNVSVLDVTNNVNLTDLLAGGNNISSIDLSNNPNIEQLGLNGNNLTSIDISNNPNIVNLVIGNNNVSTLDLSNNVNIELLQISTMNLSLLDISNNTAITLIACFGNPLTPTTIDNILIQLDSHGLSGGTAQIPTGRTTASDVAVTNLQSKSWSISEI